MSREAAFQYLDANQSRFVDELMQFLRIPSISAHPERDADVLAAMEFDKRKLESLGFKTEVWPTRSHKGLYAERIEDPSLPTVLIYGHVDVQPVDPLELWTTPPFEPQIRDGSIWARGADDNKGQHYAHVKACEAMLAADGSLPCSVKFIVEGEEEIGGPHLPPLIQSHAAQLACDVIMISDGALLDLNTPRIEYGLRGLMGFELTVRTAAHDLHSGIYGGNIANPILVLARMLAEIKNDRGIITVPHFYDDVRILDMDERVSLGRVPIDEKTMMHETGASGVSGEPGFTVVERLGARPTFEINGMWGGYTGVGGKTVLPAEAHAKITCRLVPYMDPRQIYELVTTHLRRLLPAHCELIVTPYRDGARACLIDRSAPQFQAAARAAQKTYGSEPIYMVEGGSIPVVNDFQDVLKKPVILLGFGLPGDNLHAPNEKLAVECFDKGIEASIRFLHELTA